MIAFRCGRKRHVADYRLALARGLRGQHPESPGDPVHAAGTGRRSELGDPQRRRSCAASGSRGVRGLEREPVGGDCGVTAQVRRPGGDQDAVSRSAWYTQFSPEHGRQAAAAASVAGGGGELRSLHDKTVQQSDGRAEGSGDGSGQDPVTAHPSGETDRPQTLRHEATEDRPEVTAAAVVTSLSPLRLLLTGFGVAECAEEKRVCPRALLDFG